MSTVAELLLARADDDRPGLRFEERTWSWREVVAESAARASLIRSLAPDTTQGAPAGALHVGVLLGNVPEYVFWLGAAALAGAVVVGINPTRRGEALAGDIVRTDCSLLATDHEGVALLEGLSHGIAPDRVLEVDDSAYAGLLATHVGADPAKIVDASHPQADALYLLLFTSGTTGDPKAVRCTQGRLAAIATRSADAYGFERDDVAYCAMPLFHGNALMVLWGPALVVGGTVALARRFSASGFGRDVRRYRRDHLHLRREGARLCARDAGRRRRRVDDPSARLRDRGVGRRQGRLRRALRLRADRGVRVERGRPCHLVDS